MNNKIKNKITIESLKKMLEYDEHSLIVPLDDKQSKLEGYIVIHKLRTPYPSFGATRFFKYKSKKDALKDALRLAKLMSYKSILAGLPYGGAKAVIMEPNGKYSKEKILKAYAVELNKLKDKFITGTDVGLTKLDLDILNKQADNLIGFSVNPERATAYGVMLSIKEAIKHIYKNKKKGDNYKNFSFAIQGIGKVGGELLRMLIKKGVRNIYVADINEKILNKIKKEYPFVKIVPPSKIYSQKVDIYCPCALSNALNNKTIKKLKCNIIVGSANNQLENKSIGDKLHKMNILYCPDYVVNAGGLISVVDEYQYSKIDKVRLNKRVRKISSTLKKALSQSEKKNLPPYLIVENLGVSILNKCCKSNESIS